LDQYRRAAYGMVESSVVSDTEIFLTEVITENPSRVQLCFFRGLINYKVKADYALAREDFQHFLQQKSSEQYPRLRELATKYLAESKSHLGV
jgi:hypothetical protein